MFRLDPGPTATLMFESGWGLYREKDLDPGSSQNKDLDPNVKIIRNPSNRDSAP